MAIGFTSDRASSQSLIRPRSRSRSYHNLRPSISGPFTDLPLPSGSDTVTPSATTHTNSTASRGDQSSSSSSSPSSSLASSIQSSASSVTVDSVDTVTSGPAPSQPVTTPSRTTPSSLFSFGKTPKSPRHTSSGMSVHASQPLPPLPAQSAPSHSSHHSVSRLSGSSQVGGRAQAGSPPPPLPRTSSVATLEPIGNILNSRGQRESSIYQKCQLVIRRLTRVHGFDEILSRDIPDLADIPDPVTPLWRILRRGHPFIALYNALRPFAPIVIQAGMTDQRLSKHSCYMFIQACREELGLGAEECFMISDLFQDDTSGFVKVINVVLFVLDKLIEEGVIAADDSSANGSNKSQGQKTHRQHIINELVSTELTYVNHLELLQNFKMRVIQRGLVHGDAIHQIFSNLNSLLDFQRRFLIRAEQINTEPEDEQNWGKLFVLYRNAFLVYIAYISNQKQCEEVAMREFDKLKETGGSAEMIQMTESPTVLTSFLLKPFQRLSKYPLLLRELRDKGNLDEEKKADINRGVDVVEGILQTINETIDREERREAYAELLDRVDDWKGHQQDRLGELLLHGTFTVLKGDVSSRDQEREYKIYLFESILLCCKEDKSSRQKSKIMSKPGSGKELKPKLHLKGRIFMQNVTQTLPSSRGGVYTCQIYWRGDSTLENFLIKFPTEEVMKKWANQVEIQRQVNWERINGRSGAGASTHTGSVISTGGPSDHPYMTKGSMDFDDMSIATQDSNIPRVGSMASMRSRSTTGESHRPGPNGSHPVSVATGAPPTNSTGGFVRMTQSGQSPVNPNIASCFSPTTDSPISTRTSASSALYGHNQQMWGAANTGLIGGGPRPSILPLHGHHNHQNPHHHHPSSSAVSRLRSASSPDIHNQNGAALSRRSAEHGHHVPELPPFPANLAPASGPNWNRSQGNSPAVDPGGQPLSAMDSNLSLSQESDQAQGTQSIYDPLAQLKAKIHITSDCEVVLVIQPDISFATLRERIFSKYQQRHPESTETSEKLRVKHMIDNDLITITTDMDIVDAILALKDEVEADPSQPYELELFVFSSTGSDS